jgi:hypothetical protein
MVMVTALAFALSGDACMSTQALDGPCEAWADPPSESLWDANFVDGTPVPLRLNVPLAGGIEADVSQGNDGSFSHSGDQRWAYDFDVPEGTPVVAAAGGVVVWVADASETWGATEAFRNFANYVLVDHGGGLYSAYVHLAKDSVLVVAGDVVDAGQLLGRTGMSGQMTGPHLHFHVENVWGRTLPVRFFSPTSGECDAWPAEGDHLVSNGFHAFGTDRESWIPAGTFAEDGVVELRGFPARLYERGTRYGISGATTLTGATEVFVLFLPPEGGTAKFAKKFVVTEGRFAGTLEIDDVPPDRYGVAVVAGTGDRVAVPRSVLSSVVE